MIKRIILGIVWFLVLYFVVCTVIGGVAGGIAGSKDPENASVVGARAGARAVESLRLYVLIGTALLATAGTYAGKLPGTRPSPRT
jgi:hypothetical protein